jgi:hypothetical protein
VVAAPTPGKSNMVPKITREFQRLAALAGAYVQHVA